MWTRWVCAAVFVGMAAYFVGLLNAGACRRRRDRRVEFVHAVMAASMALMFCPLPFPVPLLGWALVFGPLSLWCLVLLIRYRLVPPEPAGAEHLHHVLSGFAMTCMGLAASPDAGTRSSRPPAASAGALHESGHGMTMAGMTMSAGSGTATAVALPLAVWLLASYFGLHAALSGARALRGPGRVAAAVVIAAGGSPREPHPSSTAQPEGAQPRRLAGCCRAVMSAGMGYLLLSML